MPRANKSRTGLVPTNLPVYINCLSVPVEWRRAESMVARFKRAFAKEPRPSDEEVKRDGDRLEVVRIPGKATTYDPWEKRAQFFQVPANDTNALLAFLPTVGFFDAGRFQIRQPSSTVITSADGFRYDAYYQPSVSEGEVWAIRRLFENSVASNDHTGKFSDFSARLITVGGEARVVLTTLTFTDALALTLSVDRVLRARVRKCARPDCGVVFTFTGGHKRKYCSWYCGHIESVRSSRERAKETDNGQ